MTATMIDTIHGPLAAITLHEDFDGPIVAGHTDPACRFIAEAIEMLPGILPTDRYLPCRFCVGGTRFWHDQRLPGRIAEETAPAARPTGGGEGTGTKRPDVARWTKIDGAWFVRVPRSIDSAEGQTITVTKANDDTAEVTLGVMFDATPFARTYNVARNAPEAPQTATTPQGRPNRYGGACGFCGGHVAEGAGITVNEDGKWVVFHGPTSQACPATETPAAVQDGYEAKKGDVHVIGGTYYRIHISQGTGNPYAARATIIGAAVWGADGKLVTPAAIQWDYDRSMIFRLNEGTRATAEEAAAFGHLVGRCCFCSHAIDTPESTAVGYGPTCADKYGLPHGGH